MKTYKEIYKEFNDRFIGYFDEDDKFGSILNYAIEDGKRIRPILLLMIYEMFNGKLDDKAFNFAIGLELIHNYSLIHDDLPSMDDDSYRRSRLTVHKKFGEDMAILSGDALLNTAFEIFFENSESREDILAGYEIGKNAGINGMIKGQILDINNEQKSLEDILETYKYKTACLLISGAKAGAILAKASNEDIKNMEEFAYNLGIAFQIKDDIFDIEKDKENDKKTSLEYISEKEASELVSSYTDKALISISKYKNNEKLIDLSRKLVEREK